MDIVQKAREVQLLFDELGLEVEQIKEKSGIHCIRGCIKCCTSPNIMATTLEFYPLALSLYQSGEAEAFLEKIATINNGTVCPALSALNIDGSVAGCGTYPTRGLICRLFGYNFVTDKHSERKIAACKPMKIEQPEAVDLANRLLKMEPVGPKASDYYTRLQGIDFDAGQRLYPIGDAVRLAIETLLTHYYYQNSQVI